MPTLVDGYCDRCGEERPVLRTVPWQADSCAVCGSEAVES